MYATKSLPPHYQTFATLSLKNNARLVILLTMAGLLLFVGSGWLFVQIALWLRPDAAPLMQVLDLPGNGGIMFTLPFSWLWGTLLALVLTPLLHEAAHGLCFWLYTGTRPRFAYKVLYAYAAAPEWYMRRNPYVIVGLAPLALLSLLGVGLLPIVPLAFIPLLVAFLVLNASGAVGDIAIICWLLFQPSDLLARDTGDAIIFYRVALASLPEHEQAG